MWNINIYLYLYFTSNTVESSSSKLSSFRGAISTRSAGVVMMSYFRVFRILLPDLKILTMRQMMRRELKPHTKMNTLLMVGINSLRLLKRVTLAVSLPCVTGVSAVLVPLLPMGVMEPSCSRLYTELPTTPQDTQHSTSSSTENRGAVMFILGWRLSSVHCALSTRSALPAQEMEREPGRVFHTLR